MLKNGMLFKTTDIQVEGMKFKTKAGKPMLGLLLGQIANGQEWPDEKTFQQLIVQCGALPAAVIEKVYGKHKAQEIYDACYEALK